MFKSFTIRFVAASLIAAVVGLSAPQTARADVIGIPFPGDKPRQPQPQPKPPAPPAPPQQQIKKKYVVTVALMLEHKDGRVTSVNQDLTTHLWNPKTQTWNLQNWQGTLDLVKDGYRGLGWKTTTVTKISGREVVGSW